MITAWAMGGTGDVPPDEEVFLPDAAAATFVAGVDNPYFPLPIGATWHYEAETDEGLETDDVFVTSDVNVVNGVDAVVVQDTVKLDGVLVEDTFDWYAQDTDGNVWYLGEETCEFENDICVDTSGAWEWGIDGALPGIVMPANPTVDGQPYYQEYYVGEAEDAGEVIETGLTITVPAGTWDDCIRTRDFSTLDPDLEETKDYCPGVGNVFVAEEDANVELITTTGL
jgi:hypothetical protein